MRSNRQTPAAARDQGGVMVIVLVMIVMSSLIVIPMMRYLVSVGRAGQITHQKGARVEAVKGGLRTALADPAGLYKVCGYTDANNPGAGLNTSVTLAPLSFGSVSVTTTCTLLDYTTGGDTPTGGRYGITHILANSLPPISLAVDESVYPGSGQIDTSAWLADTSSTSAADRIFLPDLPAHGLNHRAATGYAMPSGFATCTVYFPGTYKDDLIITGSTPVYFTSGIYYFEKSVRFSGSAQVVIGGGATPGCTTDQEAVFYAQDAPPTHNISGLGATFVFGAAGRLVVDTATVGSGTSVRFNLRYVGANDESTSASAGVSILTVNGTMEASALVDLNQPDELFVPASRVNGDPPTPALEQEYLPSTLVPPVATQTPVVFVDLTTSQPTVLDIPGYVSVPQGLIRINFTPVLSTNHLVEISGGLLASWIDVTGTPPATTAIGLKNPVLQQTFRLMSQTNGDPVIRSIAVVQINQTGAYAVNSWSTR